MPLAEMKFNQQTVNQFDDSLEEQNKENVTFVDKAAYDFINPKGIAYSIPFTPEEKRRSSKTQAIAIRKSLNNTIIIRKSISNVNETFILPRNADDQAKRTHDSDCQSSTLASATFTNTPMILRSAVKMSQPAQAAFKIKTPLKSAVKPGTPARPKGKLARNDTGSMLQISATISTKRSVGFEYVNLLILNQVIAQQKITLELLHKELTNSIFRKQYAELQKSNYDLITYRFNVAAQVLQRWWRRMLATRQERSHLKLYRRTLAEIKQEAAATTIVRYWHGYKARLQLKKLKQERIEQRLTSFQLFGHKFSTSINLQQCAINCCNDVVQQKLKSDNFKLFAYKELKDLLDKQRVTISCSATQLVGKIQARIESYAATLIQTSWRSYLARKELQRLKKEKAEQLLQTRSATIIQKYWRAYANRKLISAALTIQRNWKLFKLQRNLQQLAQLNRELKQQQQQTQAAVKIQALWRGHLCRKRLYIQRVNQHKQTVAAITIQSFIRMRIQKRKFEQRLQQMKEQVQVEQARTSAAIYIQKHIRRHLAVKLYHQLKREEEHRKQIAICFFRKWQQVIAERKIGRLIQQNKAAQIIQRNWRRCLCMHMLEQLKQQQDQRKQAAIVIQMAWRSFVARRLQQHAPCLSMEQKRHEAATIIQKYWRGYQARQEYLDMVDEHRIRITAAIIIQRAWRRYLRRQARLNLSAAIISVQNASVNCSFNARVSDMYMNNFVSYTLLRKLRIFNRSLSLKHVRKTLTALQTLGKKTDTCESTCILIASDSIFSVLYSILKRCNRSEPHMQIVESIFYILLALATFDKTLPYLARQKHFKNHLLYLILKYLKNEPILLKALTVLYVLLQSNDFDENPKYLAQLRRIMARFNVRKMRAQSRKTYHFQPRWCTKKMGLRHQFNSTHEAINAFNSVL